MNEFEFAETTAIVDQVLPPLTLRWIVKPVSSPELSFQLRVTPLLYRLTIDRPLTVAGGPVTTFMGVETGTGAGAGAGTVVATVFEGLDVMSAL